MSKLDEAASKSRARDAARGGKDPGTALAVTEPNDIEIIGMDAAAGFAIEPATILERVRSGQWVAEPQVMKLVKGVPVYAFLEGKGAPAEVLDSRTKEMKDIDTWILRDPNNPGIRASILTAAQLERKLPKYVGRMVCITRLEQHDTQSGNRVTDYLVAGEPPTAGVAA